MLPIILVLFLLASIAALATVLVLSQRQFDEVEEGPLVEHRVQGPPPLPPPEYAGLSSLIANTIDQASRAGARNSAEGEALDLLRRAFTQAVDGEFAADVKRVIDGVPGVQGFHDVRATIRGPIDVEDLLISDEIDHLVVAPRGVIVIDCKVRSEKVSYDGDSVFVGRGDERSRDAMLDDVLAEMKAVSAVVDPVPVHGVIVLQDVLSLPEEIRSEAVMVQGVRLATTSQLAEILTEDGPVSDLDVVAARLSEDFEPILAPPQAELKLSGQP